MSSKSIKPKKELFDSWYSQGILGDAPCVHLYGASRADVEGCRGVLSFSESLLVLSCRGFNVTVNGTGLGISGISHGALTVEGAITSVEVKRKGGGVQ